MSNTRKLVILSFLTALTIVLTRFLSFQVQILRISLEFIPIMVAAIMFGPVAGGIVGGVADVIGFMILPSGTFFPGFTLSAFSAGFIYGLFFHGKQITLIRALTGTLVKLIIVDMLMVTTWLVIIYKTPVEALMATRLLKFAIMLAVETIFVFFGVRPLMARLGQTSIFKQSKTVE